MNLQLGKGPTREPAAREAVSRWSGLPRIEGLRGLDFQAKKFAIWSPNEAHPPLVLLAKCSPLRCCLDSNTFPRALGDRREIDICFACMRCATCVNVLDRERHMCNRERFVCFLL